MGYDDVVQKAIDEAKRLEKENKELKEALELNKEFFTAESLEKTSQIKGRDKKIKELDLEILKIELTTTNEILKRMINAVVDDL